MKKKIAAALAATFALGVTSAFAANPFTDVPAKHWAYESVSKLQKAGIVEGYSDGKFGGEKSMTRYEMAIVVAKAMTKMEKADAEQKATINKLAAEFGAELKNLGVRVETLEKNQPNLKFNGELVLRYTSQSNDDNVTASATQGQYRLRMEGNAKVDDATSYGMRVTSAATKSAAKVAPYYSAGYTTFGNSGTQKDDTLNNFSLDRAFVARQMGVVKVTAGAQKFAMGANNFIIDSTAYSYDGLKFEGKSGVVNMSAQWGRMLTTVDVASLELSAKTGKLTYGAGYLKMTNNSGGADLSAESGYDLARIITANVKYDFDSKFSLAGEYVKNNDTPNKEITTDQKANAFAIIGVYGDQALKKEGDNNFTVKYYSVGNNSIGRWTSFDLATIGAKKEATNVTNQKGWNVQYNYAFSNNLSSFLQYVKVTDDQKQSSDKGYKFYRIGLTAKF